MMPMIPITIVGNRALIFDLDNVKRLRELGVTGILSGTLSMASQQNVFLGVPLQLTREEVIWLVQHSKGYLTPSEIFYKTIKARLTEEDVEEMKARKLAELQKQKLEKDKELEEKFKMLKIDRKEHEGSNSQMSYFYEIPNTSKELFSYYDTFQRYYNKLDLQLKLLEEFKLMTENDSKDNLNSAIYESLKDKDYYIAPGMRFGGKFIAYPGDPLLYHSHLIVNGKHYYDEDIGMRDIVNGGRLATAVKKVWTIAGETKEKETRFFSVEWSGFG